MNSSKTKHQSTEVNTLIRSEIAHLWPAITNITALQKECAIVLPQLFLYCQVQKLEADQLILVAPNNALASKLKQQLPKLQLALQKAGWQINLIRIKVQVNQTLSAKPAEKQCYFPHSAVNAFSILEKNLSASKTDEGLLDALRTLLKHYK